MSKLATGAAPNVMSENVSDATEQNMFRRIWRSQLDGTLTFWGCLRYKVSVEYGSSSATGRMASEQHMFDLSIRDVLSYLTRDNSGKRFSTVEKPRMELQRLNRLSNIKILLEHEPRKNCLKEQLTIKSSREASSILSFKFTIWSTLPCVPRIAITRIESDDMRSFCGSMVQKPVAFVVPNLDDDTYRRLRKVHPCDSGVTSGS